MTEAIIPRREHQFPFHGSWRKNLYPIPQGGATRQNFLRKTKAEGTKDRKKSVLGSNHDHNHKNEKQDVKNVASDRAYKAYAHHETKPNTKEHKEKRKVFRKPYDSKGPNDDRYYVSASSGTEQSQADAESGRQEQPNVFVKLLHHQVLHYSSKSPKSLDAENGSNDKDQRDRKQSSRCSKSSEGASRPPSPKPDYCDGRKSKLTRERRLVSKSISNLLINKHEPVVQSQRNLSSSSLQLSPSIPSPDYEKDPVEKQSKRPKERDVWSNANRFRGSQTVLDTMSKEGIKNVEMSNKLPRGQIIPTETLKQVMKTRPPVAEFVKEITKVSEKDKMRQRQRENMQKEAESIFNKEKEEMNLHIMKQKEKKRPKNSIESSSEEDEAKKIYREILEVVKTNAPASLQYGRGRMVGYGEEAQDTLRRGDKKNAVRSRSEKCNHNAFTRMRQSEDRESVTTSIDSYPFSPSSPWAHALPSRYNRFGYPVFPQKSFGLASPSGPVSFAGFSSPPSQLTTSSLGPGSLHHMQQPRRGMPKRKKKWFNIF